MKVSLKGGSNNVNKKVEANTFVDAKVIPPVDTSNGKIQLKLKSKEEPIPVPKPVVPEVRVNGVPEKEDIVEEPKINPVHPVLPKRVVEEPKAEEKPAEAICPISFKNDTTLGLFDTLKEAAYNVDKYLSLILNNKSCNDQPQARKEVIDLINLVLGKVIEGSSTEDLAKIIKTLFDSVARVDCDATYEDGIHSISMDIVDSRNEDVIYKGVNNISMKVVDDEEEEEIDYNEEGPSEDNEPDEDEPLTGVEEFAATTIDLSTIFPDKKGKALLIEDGDVYLTVGDNKLLAITKVDDMFVSDISIISTKILNNKDDIIQALSDQLAGLSEEITEEEVTVNGVPTDTEA